MLGPRDGKKHQGHPSKTPSLLPKPENPEKTLLEMLKNHKLEDLEKLSEIASTTKVVNQKVPFIIYLLQKGEFDAFSHITWLPYAFKMQYLGNTVLHIATEMHAIKFCEAIVLAESRAILYQNNQNLTSLQIAVRNQWAEGVKLFLNHNKDSANAGSGGLFPLHIAAYHHNKELISLLLENGANPYAKDAQGLTAIEYPQVKEDKELEAFLHHKMLEFRLTQTHGPLNKIDPRIVELLDSDPELIQDCIGKYRVEDLNQIRCIHELDLINTIFHKSNIERTISLDDYQDFISKYPYNEIDPEQLPEAIEFKNEIKREIKLFNKEKEKLSPEEDQARADQIKLMNQTYLSRIAEEREKQQKQREEKEKMIQENPPTFSQMYIERCPILYRLHKNGVKLLHYAARLNNEHIFTSFVKNYANLKTIDEQGRNVMHHIAECGSNNLIQVIKSNLKIGEEIINKLLKQEDKYFLTPLFTAIKFNNLNFQKEIRKYGYSRESSQLRNPCHIAVIYQSLPYITANIEEFESDIQKQDIFGKTPLDYTIGKSLYDYPGEFEGVPSYTEREKSLSKLIFITLYEYFQLSSQTLNNLLLTAIKANNKDIIQLLIEDGVKPSDTQLRYTPLHLAAYLNSTELLKILDPHYMTATDKDLDGNTVKTILEQKAITSKDPKKAEQKPKEEKKDESKTKDPKKTEQKPKEEKRDKNTVNTKSKTKGRK